MLGLAHITFSHTSSPQNPASPQARILPLTEEICLLDAVERTVVC